MTADATQCSLDELLELEAAAAVPFLIPSPTVLLEREQLAAPWPANPKELIWA